MITVVDQVRPWLTPSRTLAKTTQPQRRRPDQQQRDGHADDPAGDEDGLAAVAVRQGAGEEVGRRLHRAERDDERERRGERGEPELVLGEQRQDGAFLADHAADERVDADEQARTGRGSRAARAAIGASVVGVRHRSIVCSGLPVAVGPVVGPAVEHDDVAVAASGRGCWRRSWPVRRARTSPSPARPGASASAMAPSSMLTRAGDVAGVVLVALGGRRSPCRSIVGRARRAGSRSIGRPASVHASMPPSSSPTRFSWPTSRHWRTSSSRSWSSSSDEHERPVGLDEPAEPAGEHRSQRVRHRARDVPGRERGDRSGVDDERRLRRGDARRRRRRAGRGRGSAS